MRALTPRLLGKIGALALVASLVPAPVFADTQAIPVGTVGTDPPLTNNGFNYYQPPGGYTFSWTFTANSAIDVTRLGYYDSALAGTAEPNGFGSHLVTLMDTTTGATLASTTVTARSPATGVFNYAAITPVVLNTTDNYTISGATADQYYLVGYNQAAAPPAPEINYQFQPNLNIFGTSGPAGTYNDFGPNFQFTAASNCTQNVPGRNVIALTGDNCTAAGTYNPTTSNVALPVTYNGFGLYANGGAITSTTAVGVITSDPNATGGSHGVWADGIGSTITLAGPTTITTAGANSYGVYASGGGQFTSTGALNVSTPGSGSVAVNADGAGSTITLADTTINTTGQGAVGLFAQDTAATGSGGHIVVNGTLNVTTQTAFAYDVFASDAGSQITLNGASTLNVGAGSFGLYATGGGVITTAGVTINAADSGFGGGVEADAGSSITLGAASTINLTGTNLVGVFTTGTGVVTTQAGLTVNAGANDGLIAQSGTINLGGTTTISTTGANALGASASGGGQIISTGALSVTTTGAGAVGLKATGAGSSISTALGAVSTAAALTTAVRADTGGSVTLTGGAVSTSGNGAWALYAIGAGSQLAATDVTVTTTGGVDASGNVSLGAYAQTGSAITLTNSAISTQGASAHGAEAGGASTITLSGSWVTTNGANAYGLFSTDAGSAIVATHGLKVATSGLEANGVFVDSGASAMLTGGSVATTGDGAAALFANGAGSTLTATGAAISTKGGVNAATGDQAQGAAVFSSAVTTLTNDAILTAGVQAQGVAAGSGGQATIVGGSVGVSGVDANGLLANGAGSSIATSGGLVVTSTATTSAFSIQGARADNGGALNLSATTITTSGAGVSGIGVETAGSANLNGVSVTTSGAAAHGLFLSDAGSTATLSGTNTIATNGAGAFGVEAASRGAVTATGALTVTTSGAGAHGLYATGAGASVAVAGATINTQGTGAYGAYVTSGAALALNDGVRIQSFGSGGGGVFVTGAGSSATFNGTVGISSQTGASALSVDTGGAIAVNGVLGVQAAGTGIAINGAPQAGSFSAPGSLNLKATSASSPAILLSGDNASFSGIGGGTIQAAGPVVEFLNGVNQSATFDGYTIVNTAGDLAFTDPSSSTLNYNNTTAVAGAGDLIDATGGSTVTLNASASTLTGAVATDATSTTNVNLTNNSALTLTGNSTITNLSLNNSALGFSPSTNGAFKTLTVTNFTGVNGLLTLNAALGGANPGADQLVINGGKATGTTLLTILPFGATNGAGVPLILATNGGTIAPGAFALSGPLVVNGYVYSLQAESGGDYLVANTTQTPAQASSSLAGLSQSRQTQTITARVLGSILTGATEQINCSSCSSGFASFGSFALGAHGRWTVSPSLAILAGGSYDSFSGRGVTVNNSMQAAVALRYDAVALGKYRPFVEAGITSQPWASVTYSRSYASALGGGVGTGTALSRSVAAYGRAGYIWRLTNTDEAAVYSDLTRSWDYTSGYTESATPGNPNGAVVSAALDTLNVWRTGGQFTHLFGQHIEGNLSGGFAQAFGAAFGTSAALGGIGVETASAATGFHWWELGGRVSYRFSKILTGDLFLLGTLGAQPVGDQLHGGAALRFAF